VRALLALGMLLSGCPSAQLELASEPSAPSALLNLVQSSTDADAKAISQDLFKLLAANGQCKGAMVDAMRSSILGAAQT